MVGRHKWLQKELELWLVENLVTEQQAGKLRLRYPAEKEHRWGKIVVPTIGSIVFGLGVILFFAYNWADMPKFVKLATILVSVGISHGLAIRGSKGNISNAYSESLHCLGTMLFAAAVILIAQIYHIDDYYPNAIFLFAIAALSLAWARTSMIQALLATVFVTAWAGSEIFDYSATNHSSLLIILIGIVPFALHIRSAALMFFVSASLMMCYSFNLIHMNFGLLFQGLFFLSCIYMLGSFFLRNILSEKGACTIRFIGMLVYFAFLFAMSFRFSLSNLWAVPSSPVEYLYYGLPMAGLLAILIFSFYKKSWQMQTNLMKWEIILVSISLVCVTYIGLFSHLKEYRNIIMLAIVITINLTLAAHYLLLIIGGSRDTKWVKTSIGCVLLAILIFARFTDLFHNLLWRSAAFLLLGAGLFAVGHYYNDRKKQVAEVHHG